MATLIQQVQSPRVDTSTSSLDRPRIKVEQGELGVVSVIFDHPDKAANLFDRQTLAELEAVLMDLAEHPPTGVVFLSAKSNIYMAGADLQALDSLRGDDLRNLGTVGQRLFDRVAALPVPTVAAIHGACLGGGMELALACDWRLASDAPETRLGLPETQLGILPAWGGSTRLPRLIGLPRALDHILKGKPLSAQMAAKLGMVDQVLPRERLLEAALERVKAGKPRRKTWFFTNNPVSALLLRKLVHRRFPRETLMHYPALEAALRVVTRGAYGNVQASLLREREALVTLAETETASNLMHLFYLQKEAKKMRVAPEIDLATLPEVRRAAVVGAGAMGSGIAQWLASREIPVSLLDISPERVSVGMRAIDRLFAEAKRRHLFTKHEVVRYSDLVTPAHTAVPLHLMDLVIEAAVEDLEVKKQIFADLCTRTSPATILATNTSALSVGALAAASGVTHPERVIGLHFFNPVSRMKLVEVVVAEQTSPATVERTLRFVRAIGKLPVVVKDSPGFLVNRILMPYLIEAARLVQSGYEPEVVDKALVEFGMPMGPLALLDVVGLDVAMQVADTMTAAWGERFEVPLLVASMVREGHLGRKSGRGFYHYERGKAGRASTERIWELDDPMAREEIAGRLISLMVHEARHCLDEGVAAKASDIDLAMVLGTGFAPFRGGPLRYASQLLALQH